MIKRLIPLAGLMLGLAMSAQAATAASPVAGTWEGTLPNGMGGQIRVVLKVAQATEGLTATMDSPDQGASGIPVKAITFDGEKLRLDVEAVGGTYEGAFDQKRDELSGTWQQGGQSLPLVFKREAAKK